MKNFVSTIIKRPVTICMLVIILLVAGVMATLDMPINLLPNMDMPFVSITVVYPGASANTVEEDVTEVLESDLKSISDVATISSYSLDNASAVVMQFNYGVDVKDKIADIEDCLDKITFPSGCEKPTISMMDLNSDAVASVSVYRTDNDFEKTLEDAKKLKELFLSINGVGDVQLVGAPSKSIKIKSIEGLDVSTLLIAQALGTEGLNIPFGTIMENGEVVSIRNLSDAKSVEDINKLPIKLDLSKSFYDNIAAIRSGLDMFGKMTRYELAMLLDSAKLLNESIIEVEAMNATTAKESYPGLVVLDGIMSLIESKTAQELVLYKTEVIDEVAKRVNYMSNSDEIQYVANTLGVNVGLVGYIAKINYSSTFVNDYWNKIVSFRTYYPRTITNDQWVSLFRKDLTNTHGSLDIISTSTTPREALETISKVKALDLNVFLEVIETKLANEEITNEQFVRLFKNEDLSVDMISFVRRDSFSEDATFLRELKNKYVDNYGNPVDKNNEPYVSGDGEFMTNADVKALAEQLGLVDSLNLELNDDILTFVLSLNLDKATITNDTASFIVPLSKIGHVEVVEEYDSYSTFNGKQSITVAVHTISGSNTTAVVEKVKELIQDAHVESNSVLVEDKSKFINDSIDNIISSIIIGAVLAVVVILFFTMKIKSAIVISITMPLSVISSLLCLWAMGISLNMVSLGGLAVGIGMLVDNSIVVLESITKRRDEGEELFEGTVNGTKEVAGSLLASTLTNVCVFFPILFMEGMTKEIFGNLVYSVVFSITISLIVALTVIPTLFYLLYRNSKSSNSTKGKLMEKMEAGYEWFMRKALKFKVAICLGFLLLFASSVALVFTTGVEFLPSIDQQTIEVQMKYPITTSVDEANDATNEFVSIIEKIKGVGQTTVQIGKFGMIDANYSGMIRLELAKGDYETSKVASQIRQKASKFTKATSISVTEIDGVVSEVTSGFASLSCSINGPDLDALKEITEEVRLKLLESKYIASAISDISDEIKEYQFTVDKEKCLELGIEYSNVVMLLRAGIAGYDAANIKIDGEELKVVVSFADKTTSSIASLKEIMLGFANGEPVKLKDVLTSEPKEVMCKTIIKKVDGLYQASIEIESENVDTGTISNEIKTIANEVLAKYPDYHYVEGGVSSYLSEAFSGLVVALVIAFFLLYAVMACQFESLIKPVIIIVSIPLAFTGGFFALTITNTSLNVVSFIGIIMLMGVVVNNAIIMIDKIALLTKEGASPLDAVVKGSSNRLRAILMTTLTTVLALVPLSMGLGAGGELMQPMGIVVLGGLTLGTVVTLVIIPCFYCIIKRIKTKTE